MIRKDNNNIVSFFKFSCFIKLFYCLQSCSRSISNKKSFCFRNLSCCMSTFFICYFYKFINKIKICCCWN